VRKLVGFVKDNLIGKAKPECASKATQGIHSLLPIGRRVFSHLQESRAPSRVTDTWEDNVVTLNVPLLSSSVFIAEHDVVWYGITLWAVGVSCPSCVPS